MNPKKHTILAAELAELDKWACLEAKVESDISKKKIWREVRDWADGTAAKYKLKIKRHEY